MKNEPIIIIGAGRSGTNILRDTLCRLKGFKTWPCDEINYIWRHGNIARVTDRFTANDARKSVKQYIEKKFEHFENNSKAEYVVEKTCANSLKVAFINSIFPKAKYVFIIRNGYDVASSAKLRWTASLDLGYIFKKLKFVPLMDIPYYGFRYFINRVRKLFSIEKRLAFWGPLYPRMEQDLKEDTLINVCAKQWRACVETAYSDLSELAPGRFLCLKYEDFVMQPMEEMKKVICFVDRDVPDEVLKNAIGKVSPKSIGNYKKHITQAELVKLRSIINPTMENIYNKI